MYCFPLSWGPHTTRGTSFWAIGGLALLMSNTPFCPSFMNLALVSLSSLGCSLFVTWPSGQVTIVFPFCSIKVPLDNHLRQSSSPLPRLWKENPLPWVPAQGPYVKQSRSKQSQTLLLFPWAVSYLSSGPPPGYYWSFLHSPRLLSPLSVLPESQGLLST